jgi:ABC-type multidrug transport system fused ATPase/permease subunit
LSGRAFAAKESEPHVHFSTTAPIVIRDCNFSYPGEQRRVLIDLNVEIQRNSITALVGRSGAGKSTLADLLLALVPPTSGSVTVDGLSIHATPRTWQRSCALVSQSVFLTDESVAANISFGARGPFDHAKMARAAQMARAHSFIEELPQGFECALGESGGRLSGGQRQRIGIARALYNEADVVLFDEPTSALDNLAEREVMQALFSLRKHKTIILITHRIELLKDADRILVLEEGSLAGAGTYQALVETCPAFASLIEAGD